MSAGLKKFQLEIFEQKTEVNEYGEQTEKHFPYMQLKAELKFSGNAIRLENNEIVQTDRITFRTYKRPIKYTDQIRFNNVMYAIESINPYYNNEIEIICSKINV